MHIVITFGAVTENLKDILIAELQDQAEGFEENENTLKAIFLKEAYSEDDIAAIASAHQIGFQKEEIAPQNWNALWESNFDPVIVDDFVGIRASFHQPLSQVEHEIVITPKMSFGTGHHATTHLMMQQMRKLNFKNCRVFDFGTGTGVLAILAQKLGATTIIANDIDEWSIINARENFDRNHTESIELIQSDSAVMNRQFDIILANINRNVLVENIPHLAQQLTTNGHLLLSGILEEDISAIKEVADANHLALTGEYIRNKWVSLTFIKLEN